jgi:hypothetical protein
MRVAAIKPPAAGEAAPRVRATVTAMPISSMTKMPSSIQASSLALSMSAPHSSTILPISVANSIRALSGASEPSATFCQAAMKASMVVPEPPYASMMT